MSEEVGNRERDILKAVFSSIEDAVLVIDSETRSVVHCNAATSRIFGYEPAEIIGRNTSILHTDKANYEEFGGASEEVLDRGGSYRTEFSMRRKDGSSFAAEIAVTPISEQEDLVGRRHLRY